MFHGIEDVHAYDFNCSEVDSLDKAVILFVDTKKAAVQLDYFESDGGFCDEYPNEDCVFDSCKPDVYVFAVNSPWDSNGQWMKLSSAKKYMKNMDDYYKRLNNMTKKRMRK